MEAGTRGGRRWGGSGATHQVGGHCGLRRQSGRFGASAACNQQKRGGCGGGVQGGGGMACLGHLQALLECFEHNPVRIGFPSGCVKVTLPGLHRFGFFEGPSGHRNRSR